MSFRWLEDIASLRTTCGLVGNDNSLFDLWYSSTVQQHFVNVIAPQLSNYIADKLNTKETPVIQEDELYETFSSVVKFVQLAKSQIKEFQHDENSSVDFGNIVQTVLSKDIPGLQAVLFFYFKQQFTKFNDLYEEENFKFNNVDAGAFRNFCQELQTLQLVPMVEEICTEMLFHQILHKISDCLDNSEEPYGSYLTSSILPWVEKLVFEWLKIVLFPTRKETQETTAMLNRWKSRIYFHVYETFARLRISQMFDIIVDYPESTPTLVDLKTCLKETNMQLELVNSLVAAFNKRLLLPGVTTESILQIYVSTIKALRKLDPSGALLVAAGAPVGQYLKQRNDTIRCIVSQLTDDTSDGLGLFEELKQSTNTVQDVMDEDSNDEDENEIWNPAPLHVIPGGEMANRPRALDIISTLVNIYGSKEPFVNEFTAMLGERLLLINDFDTKKEVINVELLKLKFGEQSLINCEIMLKDMADSKRANTYVHTIVKKSLQLEEFPVSATIVSGLFWPPINEEKFKIPESITKFFDLYNKEYTMFKKRSLYWKPLLGSVSLTLNFGDKSMDFEVPPIQAAIITLFEEKIQWTASELAEKLEIDATQIRRRINFWINNGILSEIEKDVYQANSEAKENDVQGFPDEVGEEQADEEEDEDSQFIDTIKQFVQGMCSNFGALSCSAIHAKLSTFLPGYAAMVPDSDTLAVHLDKMVKEGALEVIGDTYSLPST